MFLAHRYFTAGNLSLNPCPSLGQSRDARESNDSLDVYEAVKTEEKRQQRRKEKYEKRRDLQAQRPPKKPEGGCCDCALCRCLKRVPYGTLFAILLLAGGLALLTYEIIYIRIIAGQMFFNDAKISISDSVLYEGTGTLFWVLIGAVAIMGLYGFLLLIFACLTSGPSGQNTCGREAVRCIGLCSTDILIMVTYVVCAVWLALTVVLAMPFTFMLMVRSYCKNITPSSCIDLSHYGLAGNVKTSAVQNNTMAMDPVCGNSLQNFCDRNGSIWLSSFLAMAACIMIVIALIHFLMALSANHTYQKMLGSDQPSRSKYGNDYRRAYGDADIPLQEPLNIHDESTRF